MYWRPAVTAVVVALRLPLDLPLWGRTMIGVAVAWAVAASRQFRFAWKVAAATRSFRTLSSPQVTIYYSPLAGDQVALRAFQMTVVHELRDLARQFGRSLRSPVVVFLFGDRREVSRVVAPPHSACAIWDLNAIILSADCDWEELVRHELTHLFAGRLSRHAPPLLSEGLAVWLQGNRFGRRVDDRALEVLDRNDVGLDLLLDPVQFFDGARVYDCYTLAGSFTGFLIRRFGWKAYERLYRQCDGREFRAKFRKCFGLSLKDAHWEWRLELRLGDN